MHQKIHVRNPYWKGLIPLAVLTFVFGFITLLAFSVMPLQEAMPSLRWAGLMFTLIFSLVTASILLLGLLQVKKIKSFWRSERPLIRWTYSQVETQQFKAQEWRTERNDWKIQMGCLAGLLALAGFLTGVMVGAENGVLLSIVGGVIGFLVGTVVGGILGVLVAGGNRLALVWDQRDQNLPSVALGVGEIYANGQYFKADSWGRAIQSVDLIPGDPVILEVHLRMPMLVRMPDEEVWRIPVPATILEKTKEILPLLLSRK